MSDLKLISSWMLRVIDLLCFPRQLVGTGSKNSTFGFLNRASNANKWNLHANRHAWEITLINGGKRRLFVLYFCISATCKTTTTYRTFALTNNAACRVKLFAFASLRTAFISRRKARLLVTWGEYYHSLGAWCASACFIILLTARRH